jgi:hypothetical protein
MWTGSTRDEKKPLKLEYPWYNLLSVSPAVTGQTTEDTMSGITSLSELCELIVGCTIIYNDRGNGCGGPGREDATDVLNEINNDERDDEAISMAYDEESWDLARDAYKAFGLNPAGISEVYVNERKDGDNGHQTIYVV